ncbi:MAG: hypothetical protein A3D96_01930 [Chlamydiae bacterium RIFCSPHIGHO2_12_FULL_44_59]|nr:MAG: hypothetical protein A2796_04620 [Chlamydiae bacterium RIFCSPHIGHO2_01_FULL_44_39]OGN60669.1 MAG: hypothetical protein A3D96_01930 [Chlamydiae bacterium RIFCSPHIGHO2_12_FULL_44_59]OGN66929.1 MAG: hypothetical protein A2978_02160 [Chlamydiae bacterium RIFCSPLOWO2_01_FULL_44_52]OGN67481.1 MAG: hypothetical protein A3I67_03375 [Chlamydiae bacterium RIFCSPLOWO2_02_FULL_45_22]OGN71182.1 MAG: hypothetical protein A3F79_02400 [Chlamydiae bacterium RIFCSPLOWO2_12_FULL_45_20]
MFAMKVRYLGDFQTECTHESGARIVTHAPKDVQGGGGAFSPTDLMAVSVGACMLTLISMMGKKLGIELKGMTAEVEKHMVLQPKRKISKMILRIRSSYSPSKEEQEKLEKAALDCPVHLSLHPDIQVELDFVWGL